MQAACECTGGSKIGCSIDALGRGLCGSSHATWTRFRSDFKVRTLDIIIVVPKPVPLIQVNAPKSPVAHAVTAHSVNASVPALRPIAPREQARLCARYSSLPAQFMVCVVPLDGV